MPRQPDFETLIRRLCESQVRFVIIGGLALRLQGSSHVTDDLDVVYARSAENYAALVEAIAPLHPRLRGAPERLPFLWDARTLRAGLNFTLVTDASDFDLLGEAAGVDSFQGLWDRAAKQDAFGFPIRVASIDDLIAMKRAAGRPQDLRHIAELEALKKVLAE